MIALLLFAISAINFFLALLFFSKGFKNLINFFFALFILGAAIWPLAIAFFNLSNSLHLLYLWDRVIYISGTLVPVSFLFFSYLFINKKPPGKVSSIFYLSIPTVLIFFLLFSNLFIQDIRISSDKIVTLGAIYPFWVIYFSAYMATSTFWLWQSYHRNKGLERVQLSYILIAVIFPIIGSFPFNIILPLFGNYKLIFVGPIFLTAMAIIITYAIIKHRLMDIRFIAARTVAYSLLVTIIGVFYVSVTFVVSSLLLGSVAGFNQTLIYTGLTVFVALSFDKLRNILERITDRIFFKGTYNSQDLLSTLGKKLSSHLELDLLTSQFLQVLISQMRVTRGMFVILGEELLSIYRISAVGYSINPDITFEQIRGFFPFHDTLVFDELQENDLKQRMRELNIGILKVLFLENKVVGVLILGEKASGEAYSGQDINILEILAPELAVSIQNSLSYDKIKKFNLILTGEVKKATSELQTANLKLRQLDKLKDDFVSVASHELRTPMTAIKSYVWMALHKSDIPLSQKLEKYLYRTLISTERLINLVNDMLNVSRIEAGKIEIEPKSFDMTALVKEVCEEVRAKADEKRLQIQILEHKVPLVFADADKVHQILLNLVGNSLKFTYPGGIITIDFFTDGQMLEVSVKDNGAGITKEDLSKLFHKFARLDNSYISISTSGGTGLGLYISKSLVELMKGRIWASSEGVDKGSTFTFSLPVANKETLKNAKNYEVKAQGEVKPLESVAI